MGSVTTDCMFCEYNPGNVRSFILSHLRHGTFSASVCEKYSVQTDAYRRGRRLIIRNILRRIGKLL